MARPRKTALDYFPLDCHMDDKVEMLEAVHGLEGFAVYIKLLQEIYQTENGEFDMSIVFRWKTLCRKYGIHEDKLRLIIGDMMEIGLFDQTSFDQRKVLTSSGVKKRLNKVEELRDRERKRKQKPISDPVKKDQELSGGKPKENATKEKEKEKESKEKTKKDAPTGAVGFSFPLNWTPSMISAYEDSWLVYRQKGFKTKLRPESIQKQIIQLSELPEPQVIACINNSIANGYQGLILDKFRALNGTHINGTGTAFQAKHAIPD